MTPTKPLIIAHRGATAHAPENSYEAVLKSIERAYQGIEVDLRRTKDGEFVCFHDESIERLTGHKQRVAAMTASELRALKLHAENPTGGLPLTGRVIFFEELLDLARKQLFLNIELKAPTWKIDVLETKILAAIQKRGMEKQVLISSFYHLPLLRLQRLTASVRTGFLIHPTQYRLGTPGWSSKWLHLYSIHPPYHLVKPEHVEEWRQAGYAIFVWDVNKPAQYERLTLVGVDGIITDIPEVLGDKHEPARVG